MPLAIAGKDMWPSMHLWTYLALRIGGGDALAQMVQTGDWNTDACKAAGDEVLKLNALDPYQPGFKAADYDTEAAAVGNGKAAMEVMGQWAPAVQMDQSTSKKGLGADLGWFPFPTVTGGAGAADRRRRRRQRHRGRQERLARGARLPQVLQQRRERDQDQHRQLRPVAGGRHREHDHRPEPAGCPGRPWRGDLHAALPRPGHVTGHGHGDQRGDHRAVRRRVDAGPGLPGDHRTRRRRSRQDSSQSAKHDPGSERAGPRRPARFPRR